MIRRSLAPWIFLSSALAFLFPLAPYPVEPAAPDRTRPPLEVTEIVRSAGPSVVMIRATGESGNLLGTGFVLSSDGLIVTNYHVIAGATDVQVKLTNGWLFSALGVVGFREEWDLALIKIAGPPLPFVELGNSDNLQPGQRVVLIGNPQGLANTVADGLVSSLRENERGIKVIQTTTPASKGNSGSPLFNMQGEVVGIVSFKIIGGENLNFALPANLVREIALRDQPIPFVSLAPSPPSTPQPPPSPSVASRPPEMELYKNALTDYTKRNYDLAITGFRAYIQNYPKTSLVANAQYWLGESYYSQKNYAQAVEEFDVVIRDYPDSPKVPSALFKQGDAYLQLNDTKRASAALCELITKYPQTREARLARQRNVRCRWWPW